MRAVLCYNIFTMDNPLDDLQLKDVGSTPQSEWDTWYATTHKNTKASWDVAEEDDADELDIEKIEYDED
jgi:hypothetical protein